MSKEVAIERAKSMANDKIETFSGYKMKKYNIKSNPYHRKHKLHVVWHNAFYDECKRIGRYI
jgi:hypothetical protein